MRAVWPAIMCHLQYRYEHCNCQLYFAVENMVDDVINTETTELFLRLCNVRKELIYSLSSSCIYKIILIISLNVFVN